MLVDIFFTLTFIIDIFVRSRVAFVINDKGESHIVTSLDEI